MGYNLSAELLTHASINSVVDSVYSPVYGSRVIASQISYNIASGLSMSGGADFPNSGSSHEKDLYYAIHSFDYTKSGANGKTVNIKDRYDFEDSKDYTGLVDFVVHKMFEAQQLGVIKPFQVRITQDLSEILQTTIVNKSGNTWRIQVANLKNSAVEVIYNAKMCNGGDAENWTGLTDIKVINISANSSQIVDVQENGTSTHIAFSYINGSERVITYSYGLDVNGNRNPNISKAAYNYYGNIGIVGKNGNKWIIKVTNNYVGGRTVEYNANMCNVGDAQNWTALNDRFSFYLHEDESRNVDIYENWYAAYIAVSFSSDSLQNIRYANNLHVNGTMSVYDNSKPVYKYLSISNAGKSGSAWKINIYNPTSSGFTVYYNAKMCNVGDAQNWSALNDEKSIYLDGNVTKQVTISENWFAAYIAISYKHSNGTRLITYANGLTTGGGINVMTNYK